MEIIGKGTNRGRDLVERAKAIADLMREKKDLTFQAKVVQENIAESLKAAAALGLDKKALAQCVKELVEDRDALQARFDFEQTVDSYRNVLGLIPGGEEDDRTRVELRDGAAQPVYS